MLYLIFLYLDIWQVGLHLYNCPGSCKLMRAVDWGTLVSLSCLLYMGSHFRRPFSGALHQMPSMYRALSVELLLPEGSRRLLACNRTVHQDLYSPS